jgi:hypothetical protein
MRLRKSAGLGLMVLLLAGNARAVPTLVGAVTVVSEGVVHVKTNDGGVKELTIDDKTQYIRWITHQPWQQSTVADRSFIKVGRCISVEPRADDDRVAKIIRVNTDEIGTIWCPCRTAH